MSKVSYTKAPFKFHKNIRYCFQYRIKSYSDTATLHSFLSQFNKKSGLYCLSTDEGVKIGITTNLKRRFREHITPWVNFKSISFLCFNSFPLSELRRAESMLISQYSDHSVNGCNEFFKDVDGFKAFNQAKSCFYKLTSKKNRVSGQGTTYEHLCYSPQARYTTQSQNVSELLGDFYSKV